ncbi:D-sedoheptulose 7-phosphate isomerase [bacterium]|jgi:D-sedoheptulose 7-phosphate isomerase|nr:D-sedoheptulose 7-phosphate isomerase [bacterium]
MINKITEAFENGKKSLDAFCSDPSNFEKVEHAANLLTNSFNNGGKALICGNGGSSCDAMHFAEEFTGRFRGNRRPLPALSLSDPSHITCVGNDFGFDYIFSRGVEAFGLEQDIFLGISTSGNSQNVINAFEAASKKGLKTIALLGKSGGKLKGVADIEWIVPGETSDRIQEIHMMILHIMIEIVERRLFPETYYS